MSANWCDGTRIFSQYSLYIRNYVDERVSTCGQLSTTRVPAYTSNHVAEHETQFLFVINYSDIEI